MLKQSLTILFSLVLVLTACGGGGANDTSQADTIATVVAATLQASITPTSTEAPPALTGFVNGRVCTHGGPVGDVNVYLQRVNTSDYATVPISNNQDSIVNFAAEVPAGFYIAYAWIPNFRNGGSYSQLIPCGFQNTCTDHSLVTFEVVAGQTTEGVDVCDWYAVDEVPFPPGVDGPTD